MTTQPLTVHLFEITLDRSKALGIELARIKQRQYPPTGPEYLINLAIAANNQIHKDLVKKLSTTAPLPLKPDRRTQIFLRDKTYLLSFLHTLMQCIEGAEIQNCPSTFIVPIRRMLERQLKRKGKSNFDFIVKSSRVYNYMIWSLDSRIREVFLESGYANMVTKFPSPFFIIECPISEKRNLPIHCIFAHEVGHVWYQTSLLQRDLLPLVQTARDTIQQKLKKSSWVEELVADAVALCLFGPAFLFSSIYFSGPFCSMSDPSETHPPDGLRIEFMCMMLLSNYHQGGLGYRNYLDTSNLNYLLEWQSYAIDSITTARFSRQDRAMVSVMRRAFPHIMNGTKRLTAPYRYSGKDYVKDVPALCENIANGIPPNEIITDFQRGVIMNVRAESILNAGWSYLISGDQRYAELLNCVDDKWKVTNRLFDLVSKGLEYSEMHSRWRNSV
jgi:hypothetical protein